MSILKYKDPKTGEFKRINPYKADLTFVGKDGITVNKATDSEEVEISGKGCVQKDKTPARVIYAHSSDGSPLMLYPQTQAELNEWWLPTYRSATEGDTATGNGVLLTDTPTRNYHCTNKKYVEANYVKKVKFTNLEQALNGYILDTTKEAYADLDSAVLKDSVAVGDNVYPIADKTRALVTRIEGKSTKMVQLFDKSVIPATRTVNGITFINNNDGSITINGTATAEAYIIIVARDKVTNGNKVLYGSEQNTSNYGVAWGTNLNPSKFNNISTQNNFTIKVNSGVTVDNVKIYPQLFDLTAMNREDITTAEQFKAEYPELYPYENGNIYPAKVSGVKFYENQDKSGEQASVTLPETYDLHGIGDYKDYLEITKNEDNELYTLKKVQQIEKRVLDGTETINKSGYITDNYQSYYILIALLNVNNGLGGICNKLPTAAPNIDIEHVTFGINNVYPYLFLNKETYTTQDSVKEYFAAQYAAGDPIIIWYILQTPVETVIATNLTYEQVTAIRHNNGLIEVEGNANKGYTRPTIKNTIVYRLTATNTAAEG